MANIEIGEIFTKNLKKLLEINDMSYKEFAEKIDVKASSVSMWMNGKSLPRMGTLDKISNLFNIPRSSLLEADNDHSSPDLYKDKLDMEYSIKLIEKNSILTEDVKQEQIKKLTKQINLINDELLSREYTTATKSKINKYIDMLNEAGQNKAVDQVEMLTKINEYRKVPKASDLFEGIGKNSNEIAGIIKDSKPTP